MLFTFHILGVPHTITSPDFNACAYTQKILKFSKMMKCRGHKIIHYGHELSTLDCSEHVNVLSNEIFEKIYGNHDWKKKTFIYNTKDEAYQTFYKNAIKEIAKRKKPRDFLLPFWGAGVKPICDAHSDLIVVEPGIGYSGGHFARWKIWESYALYHAYCGLSSVGTCKQDNYSVVIPNYFDSKDFDFCEEKEDYALFVGRVYNGKGVNIASDAAKRAGVKLIVAGQISEGYKIDFPDNVEFIGYADIETRKKLMSKAMCALIPSQYVEPFGGVQIENLLSGTPTITSDWGAFAENNVHGLTGYRCRTMGDYVDAIVECKNKKIDYKACRKFGENFLLENIAPRYEKYFQDVMNVYTGNGWYEKGSNINALTIEYPIKTKNSSNNFLSSKLFKKDETLVIKENLYSRDFHKSIENDEFPQAVRLANYIVSNFSFSAFLDFGCSTGLYLNEIKKLVPTIECIGYEFSENAVKEALCNDVLQYDLTQPLKRPKIENTLGLCLEVLEHIDDLNWVPVLLNITNLSNTIIFSAAVPGQGGTGHINCRHKIDWIRRFHSLGWVVDLDRTRQMIDYMKKGYHMGWFANNAMILVKA
jgi:glycosyltransferase involved in cell wall biosynthesis